MFISIFNPNLTKCEFYTELEMQTRNILHGEKYWVTNLANASSLIFYGLNTLAIFNDKKINWAGFYLRNNKINSDFLYLGPFQGKLACTKIKMGRGVCGTTAFLKSTQVVEDVSKFEGHIACDSETKSEIVIPLICPDSNEVLGVLDIDSLGLSAFDEEDKIGLEKICKLIVDGCDWNN